MDIATARTIALNEFDGEEYDHFGKVAYRLKAKKPGGKPGRTFMTLWTQENRAVLMLNVEQQSDLHARHPKSFEPHPSKWGTKGATFVDLVNVSEKVFREGLDMAASNAGPDR